MLEQGFYRWLNFHGGRASDPHGGSPRGLEGVIDSFEGYIALSNLSILDFPFCWEAFILGGSPQALFATFSLLGRGERCTPNGASIIVLDELLSGNPSENSCPVRWGWLLPGGVLIKPRLVWSRILVSFDRVQRLDASLHGDSSRPPCPCLGYS